MILSAPEIAGSKCNTCGSVLLRLSTGPFCDWCEGDEPVTNQSLLEELQELAADGNLATNPRALALVDDFYEAARDDGYENGYDSCMDNCGDEW